MRRIVFVLLAVATVLGGLAGPAAAQTLRPPTGLLATSVTATSARINWVAASGATGYEVSRATTSGGPYTPVGRVTTVFFDDTGLVAGTAYFYVVRSTAGSRISGPSDQLRLATAFPAPSNIRHTAYPDRVELTWDPVPGAVQYAVGRHDETGGNPVMFSAITTPSYVDTTVAPGTAYSYRIYATGSGTNSISGPRAVFTGSPTAVTLSISPSPNEGGGFVLLTASIRSLDPAVTQMGGSVAFYLADNLIRITGVESGRNVADLRWRAGAGMVTARYLGERDSSPNGSSDSVAVRHRLLDGPSSPRIAVGAWQIYGHGLESDPSATAVGDVTGDGRLDALMTTAIHGAEEDTDFRLWVFAQLPDGTLAEPLMLATHGAPAATMAIATGDVDADGDTDVAVSVRAGVDVFRQEGGRLTDPLLVPVEGGGSDLITGDVRLADLDADGRADIVAAGVDRVVAVPAAPGGGFAAPVLVTAAPRTQVDVADVTGDGRPDVLTRNQDHERTVFVHEQTDTGFVERWRHLVPTGYSGSLSAFAAGDVTGDGRADLVVTVSGNEPGSRLQLYVQQPAGLFAEPITYPAYDIPGPVALTDFDGDGRRDVVIVHRGWATATVMTQRTDGRLGADQHFSLPLFTGYDQRGLAVGDVTGDGKPDVVAADYEYGLVVKPQA